MKRLAVRSIFSRRLKRKFLKPGIRIVIFSLLVVGLTFWLRSDFWRVRRISCQLNDQDCPPELKAELIQLSQAERILFLSSAKIIEKIEANHSELSRVQIKKRLPDELIFWLKIREPWAAITIEDSPENEFYHVDQEGTLLAKTNSPAGLPLILVEQLPELEIGEKLEQPGISKALFALMDLQLRPFEPKRVKIVSEREMEIQLNDQIRVILSLRKNLKDQLDSLQLIFSRTKIEGKQPGDIDLRFDKPVITYD